MWSSDDKLEVPEEGTTTTHNTMSQSLQALQAPLQFLLIFLILWQSAFKISSAAVTSLIRFIKFFLRAVGQAFNDTSIIEQESAVPITHEKIHKLLGFDTQNWCTEYVVCPNCHSIYDCIDILANGFKESKKCRHVALPDHPHQRQRSQCGYLLLKKQYVKKGYRLVPQKCTHTDL